MVIFIKKNLKVYYTAWFLSLSSKKMIVTLRMPLPPYGGMRYIRTSEDRLHFETTER